jgi:sulfur relay (sulfurtransferase) complex TusBCD TusD component (DsrE family)
MAKYTLIASRDVFESAEAGHYLDLAADLRKEGNDVTLFLVQNGVFLARKSTRTRAVEVLAKDGVTVLADTFSLRERGISEDGLNPAVRSAELDTVVDRLAEGHRVIWH